MPDVLLATDAAWIHDEVDAALAGDDTTVRWIHHGSDVLASVEAKPADLVILDLQIGNMGGMATSLALRLEIGAGRLPDMPILILLDREADVFLARRADADGWLIKPIDAIRLRKAAKALLDGGDYTEGVADDAGDPLPV